MKTLYAIAIALVISGTQALASGGGGKGDELGLLAIFFIAFGVLIVMFQLVPGIILFFGMLKSLFSSAEKKLPDIM